MTSISATLYNDRGYQLDDYVHFDTPADFIDWVEGTMIFSDEANGRYQVQTVSTLGKLHDVSIATEQDLIDFCALWQSVLDADEVHPWLEHDITCAEVLRAIKATTGYPRPDYAYAYGYLSGAVSDGADPERLRRALVVSHLATRSEDEYAAVVEWATGERP